MTETSTVHEHLIEERAHGVAVLRIRREDALGALSRSMVQALLAYCDRLAGESAVRVLVITGTGRGFVAGADIGEYNDVTQAQFDDYQHLSRRAFCALEQVPQFTIAAVNGYALGGGFELALCCDVILAAQRAKLGLPEVKLGLMPGGGGTQRLSRALGKRATKLLVSTGAIVPATDLVAAGVVSRVVPDDALEEAALSLAAIVASNAPLAVRAMKRVVDDGMELPLRDALTLEQQALSTLFASSDAAEGIAAFLGKRPPVWQGV